MATVFNFQANTGKINFWGLYTQITWNSSSGFRWDQAFPPNDKTATYDMGWQLEFVADCTQLEMAGFINAGNNCKVSVDGGAPTQIANGGSAFSGYTTLATGLTAGPHLFRIFINQGSSPYFTDFRLTGGAEAIVSTAKAQASLRDNLSGTNAPNVVSPVRKWGAYKWQSSGNAYAANIGSYGSFIQEFQFIGTGLDLLMVASSVTNDLAVSVDGAADVLIGSGDANLSNTYQWCKVASGLAAGTHTVRIQSVAPQVNTTLVGARVHNGTKLSAATNVSDTTITVADATGIGVNDWIEIDTYPNREQRQVTAKAGNVLTVAALAKAHGSGAAVNHWKETPGTVTAYVSQDLSARKVVGMGDSITQAKSDGTTGPGGIAYVSYDPRFSYVYRATQQLLWEWVDLAIQGQTTANMVSRKADIGVFGGTTYDVGVLLAGTNDCNSGTVSIATFQTNYQALVDQMKTVMGTGKAILCVALFSPLTYVSSGNALGLKVSDFNGAIQSVANGSASGGYDVRFVDLSVGMALGTGASPGADMQDALHPNASGQAKMAYNLVNLLTALVKSQPSVSDDATRRTGGIG